MSKEHCHEIENKFKIHADKVENIATVLEKLNFTFKSKATLIDRWLPSTARIREQKMRNGTSKFEMAKKKTIKKDRGVKNKCEKEEKLSPFALSEFLPPKKLHSLPTVRKTRTSWTVTIKGRKYTAVIDRVKNLGEFNGFYFELETLVPFDVVDPTAEADVRALATKILKAAYKGSKDKPTKVELSYRKMALIHQSKQRSKRAKLKAKNKTAKPKSSSVKQQHHCS